ncbi:unnamed protein product [Ectocarpus sp. 6 AP-2014]
MGAKTTAGDVNGKSNEMKSLAVSYMGVPLHFLASLVWAAVSRLLTMFRPREQTGAGFNKPVSPAPQQPLVRLNNLPQSEEYFINERGRVIHFRSYLPQSADEIKAVVLFSHGYGAHCNSPRKHQMGMSMPEKGLCMYQMDLEGHGYSGGERAYIEDYNHWVDDYRQLLELVAGDRIDTSRGGPSRAGDEAAGVVPHVLTATAAQRKRLQEVPIFVAGESLGGALSILLGLSLHESNHPLLPRFKGQVLLAPAIKGNPPPAMLVAALRHLVVPLVPRWQIPSCLESVNRPEMCVLEVDERRHANHDVLGYPGGLGWGGNMRFRTGLNLIDLTAEVSRRLEHVKFPFLIMHDPEDSIVRFDSSKELTYRASTPHGSPRGRELRPMKGWLHCLLTNCPEIAIQHLQDWVLYQTHLCDGGSGSQRPETPSTMVGSGFSRRGCVTKRGGAARKSVTDVGGIPDAKAAAAAAAAAPETGAGRSLGSDAAEKPREGLGASGSVTSGGGDRAGGGARGYGGDRCGATKNMRVPASGSAASTPPAGSTLLEFFPKTAVAVAAAAGTEVAAVVGGDGTDVSALVGAVDRATPTRQPVSPSSVTDLMCVEVDRKSAGEGARGAPVVSDAGASMGDEPEPSRRVQGDLHIESPSKVAGSLR